ncbi:hypothetical protein ACTUVN_004159, partial [Pseudomonas caspiana]
AACLIHLNALIAGKHRSHRDLAAYLIDQGAWFAGKRAPTGDADTTILHNKKGRVFTRPFWLAL